MNRMKTKYFCIYIVNISFWLHKFITVTKDNENVKCWLCRSGAYINIKITTKNKKITKNLM